MYIVQRDWANVLWAFWNIFSTLVKRMSKSSELIRSYGAVMAFPAVWRLLPPRGSTFWSGHRYQYESEIAASWKKPSCRFLQDGFFQLAAIQK